MKKLLFPLFVATVLVAFTQKEEFFNGLKLRMKSAEEIQSIHSFKEVKLKNLPANSLVIFDVDETLITPIDTLLKPCGGNFMGWAKIKPEQFENYLSIILAKTRYVLVDDEIPSLISNLSAKGIAAMGFTACSTGSVGVIESMEKWRSDQLKAVGIDFGSFFIKDYAFPELVDAISRPPQFKNGILFCGDFYKPEKSIKGELLNVFLDRINLRPTQIVFIDDERKNLEAVQEVLSQRGIPFQGYLIKKPSPKFDEKIAHFQIDTLLDLNKWISDKEAEKILINEKLK